MAVLVRRRRPFHLLHSRFVHRFVYVVIAVTLIQYYYLHLSYYEALADKYSPTTFVKETYSQQEISASLRWQANGAEKNDLRARLLENRANWKTLGSGYEGDTFTYNGSVIKVFKPYRSPLRNCVAAGDDAFQIQWPPEIPISLLLGGFNNSSPTGPTSSMLLSQSNFPSVQDYFFLPTAEDGWTGEWHLVTRFLPRGTLAHAARRLRSQSPSPTAEQLDVRFRPSLNRLLDALTLMHTEHGLCHDDIKLDNIFVDDFAPVAPTAEPRNRSRSVDEGQDGCWILDDLGNTRQISHSYHTSLLWKHDNGQHPDCRMNDVLRLIRTYALFLQSATTSSKTRSEDYNDAFLTGSVPWSRLYWHTVRSTWAGATVAQDVRRLSAGAFAPVDDSVSVQDEMWEARLQLLKKAGSQFSWFDGWSDLSTKAMTVRKELNTGGSVSEKWAKIFGTMGILKTPSRGCGVAI